MLVRDRRRCVNARTRRAIASMLLAAALVAGCRRASKEANLDIRWTLTPAAPSIGPVTLSLNLSEPLGKPVMGATVRVEAEMSHAGMSPVFADAVESQGTPGAYTAAFTFSMGGDWVLLVSVVLPDGRRTSRRIEVPGVRTAA
jgi:YtkA-like protein